ncbi:hypothetical protein ACE193_15145 [Bernardetia sp. OM2101]|uniref:hypothetical protein n=1 Tax=Bernardetia sp. OM2101 TaxID=3344876 RepID=UPI0035CFE40F
MIQNITTAQINSLPPSYQKQYEEFKELTENFDADFMAEQEYKDFGKDLYQKIIKKLASESKSTPTKKTTIRKAPSKARATVSARKKARTTRKAAPKKTAAKKATPKAKTTTTRTSTSRSTLKPSESSYASKYIYSFLQLVGKKKSRNQLENLVRDMNNAIINKKVRKTSSYKEAFNYIGKFLQNLLNGSRSQSFTIKLPTDGVEKMKRFARMHETKGVRALRRFAAVQGEDYLKKHDALMSYLKNVPTSDPYKAEANRAIKTLQAAKKKKGTIKFTTAQLRGLNGIDGVEQPKKKGNTLNPYAQGAIIGAASGVASVAIQKGMSNVLSGVDMMSVMYDTLVLPSKYKGVGLDDMPLNTSILLFAKPKLGKSTLALELAKDLSEVGEVLYVSGEEMFDNQTPSKSLQNRAEKVGVTDNMFFSKELIDLEPYQFIILDSINAIGLDIEGWRALRAKYPNKFFVLISQVTKSGVFRGSQEWSHEVDTIIDVSELGIATIVGRFGSGTYEFLNPKYA